MTYCNESEVQVRRRKKQALKFITRYQIKPSWSVPNDYTYDELHKKVEEAQTVYEIDNILSFLEYRKQCIKIAKDLLYGPAVIADIINSKSTIQINNVMRGARLGL